jgi:hypothetical protein
MVVPEAARAVAATVGGLLVLAAAFSVVGTLVVPRPVTSWLTRMVDRLVDAVYRYAAGLIGDYQRRDRLLATEAAAVLLSQLVAWLLAFYIGFALLLWPFVSGGITNSFTEAGGSMWQIGFGPANGAAQKAIGDIGSVVALVTIALQIGYLPTLYAAFNRRETEVALLDGRAGVPSWGPELLARTHYALGSGVSTVDTLPELYGQWERWAADVAESHTTYLPLVRFRSPRPKSSWVTSLLAVLDSAALYLALCPGSAPVVPARLCLRGGFTCFVAVARAMGIEVPEAADPEGSISLTYQEFLDAVERLRKVDFPVEVEPAEAWPNFVGWRLNYERAAYGVAAAVDAVPALWSGPRRRPTTPIPPIRPAPGRPGKAAAGRR